MKSRKRARATCTAILQDVACMREVRCWLNRCSSACSRQLYGLCWPYRSGILLMVKHKPYLQQMTFLHIEQQHLLSHRNYVDSIRSRHVSNFEVDVMDAGRNLNNHDLLEMLIAGLTMPLPERIDQIHMTVIMIVEHCIWVSEITKKALRKHVQCVRQRRWFLTSVQLSQFLRLKDDLMQRFPQAIS